MGILIATFFVRRKTGARKKLIGVPFAVALFLQVLSRFLVLISDIMWECSDLSINDYVNVLIASNVMSRLANWALLVVFVYILNSMLSSNLRFHLPDLRLYFGSTLELWPTATLGAAGIDSLIDRDRDSGNHEKRHVAESALGGLVASRLANGSHSRSRSRARSRSRSIFRTSRSRSSEERNNGLDKVAGVVAEDIDDALLKQWERRELIDTEHVLESAEKDIVDILLEQWTLPVH